jgi:photosystem II stability/assembly factor-like uncharacterized protein
MSRQRLFIIGLLASLCIFTGSSCKTSNQNANQQANSAAKPKVGKWVAQWSSQAAKNIATPYLSLYAYSCICAVSANDVFVGGDIPAGTKRVGIFVRTTDGGQSWTETKLERPDMEISSVTSIHFINSTTGWLAGITAKQEAVVLKTTDAGVNWEATKVNFKQHPTGIFFVNESTGWMVGTPIVDEEAEDAPEVGPTDLLVTYDGGKTWQSQRRLPVGLKDIQFLDANTGWVVGQKGAIYRTTDSGRSWDTQKSELEPGEGSRVDLTGEGSKKFNISGVSFSDANNGFVAAINDDRDEGRVLGTSNGGATWSKKLIGADYGHRDVFTLNAKEAWALSNYNRYVYYTADGGQYWNSEFVDADQDVLFFRIHGVDATHLWAAAGGAIYHRVVE